VPSRARSLGLAALLALLAAGGPALGLPGSGARSLWPGGSGQLCGSPDIAGEKIRGINGPGACGVRRPVLVRSVAGVTLQPPPTITCDTARALETWIVQVAKPEAARAGARLTGLDVADHYSCRNRNRAKSGKLSEHAKGRAIDISVFRLGTDGTASVAGDWHDDRFGPMLRRIHAAGCGPFRTTLGPGSDGFHEDHLHYDIERRRGGGTYCR
jgi:hypothetical protein